MDFGAMMMIKVLNQTPVFLRIVASTDSLVLESKGQDVVILGGTIRLVC